MLNFPKESSMQIEINNSLKLKLVSIDHAERIFDLVNGNRIYLGAWMPWVELTVSVNDTKDYIQSSLKRYSVVDGFDCTIFYNNSIVGLIGLHKIDCANKITSMGYWLGEKFQGQGIMTEACKALTKHCFSQLQLNRVEIKCATKNFKSQAIPERLGYKKEGTIRQAELLNGEFVDHFLYAKISGDEK